MVMGMVIMLEEEKGVEEEERPKKKFNQKFNQETNARLD